MNGLQQGKRGGSVGTQDLQVAKQGLDPMSALHAKQMSTVV
jgi:hypothetical protein